jgi:DNA-binding transcriptional ArsR family regulator
MPTASAHLGRLEDAGLVSVTKEFVGRIPGTSAALTPDGRERLAAHWRDLHTLAHDARRWRPASPRAVN